MSGDSTKGIFSPPFRGLLDRVSPRAQDSQFSEIQSDVDRLVGSSVALASDEKTMASLFGAGLAGRFVRLGSFAASGKSALPWAAQAFSHTAALTGESAVFAGMERKFAAWEGHAPIQSFQKDWVRAAINLGSIKLLGGATRGQNRIVQHLSIDWGMVAGHHAGYSLGVSEKPQGNLAQQMIHAEGMNLGMKAALALLHGAAPGLSALEKSLDLSPTVREANPTPFFGELAPLGPQGTMVWMKATPPPKPPRGETVAPAPGASRAPSEPVAPGQATYSLLPPEPIASVQPMSNAQLQLLRAITAKIQAPKHRTLSLATLATELFYAGHRAEALQYFKEATSLIDSLPVADFHRGRAFSHLALEMTRAGDRSEAQANFRRAVEELHRFQGVPNRSPERTLEAYGMVFAIAGDLMGAGREDTALKLLDQAIPTYQRVLGFRLPGQVGEDAVMKLASQAQFEEALILAGRIHKKHYPEALLKLGRSAARQGRFKVATDILYLLDGSKEQGDLRMEIFKAHALRDWDEANQFGLSVEDAAERTHMGALTARLLPQIGDPHHAGAIHDAQAAYLRDAGGSFPPELRMRIFALLAGNCALWHDAQGNAVTIHNTHYPALYDSARGELDPFLRRPRELDKGVTEALVELVFSMRVAGETLQRVEEGERIEKLLGSLTPSARSRVIGEVGVKLVEARKVMSAFVWLDSLMKGLPDHSLYERALSLRESELGNLEQALFLAQHITDLGVRFDAFWQIFSLHRGAPLPELLDSTLPPPKKTGNERPPLPGSKS